MKKYKICGIVTKAFAIRAFMLDNLKYAQEQGVDCSFVCGPEEFSKEELGELTYFPIKMDRGYVSPFEIIRVIYQLTKLFKREKFDLIQYSSSNAGLYAAIAGWLAGVPVRVYCMWGLTYTDCSGFSRFFYKSLEKIICWFSTSVQPDSISNMNLALNDKLTSAKKLNVILKGSAAGVDLSKYNIQYKNEWRDEIRTQYNIPAKAKVFGYVGRLVPEKGLNELFEAFSKIEKYNVFLILVGPNYNIEGLNQKLLKSAQNNKKVIFVGPVLNAAKYYAAMDFLVLPSYREGFGAVVIEAAGLAVPTICSNINGPTDFVKDSNNGFICEPKSSDSLYNAMLRAESMSLNEYNTMSKKVYEDVKRDFDAVVFKQFFLKNRLELIQSCKDL